MLTLPMLETERLVLRRFEMSDAETMELLMNEPQIIAMLIDAPPQPYTIDAARRYILHSHEAVLSGEDYVFGIEHKAEHRIIGYIDVEVNKTHQRGEIAYWLFPDYWRFGYATEAAKRIIEFAFDDLKLNRVYAHCLACNVASARVLMKAGLHYEGTLRQDAFKNGVFEDVEFYGLTRAELNL